MQLQVVKSKNAISYYVIESFSFKDETGKRKYSSRVVEKLGTHKELLEKLNGQDPHEWCKQRVAELNQKKKEGKEEIISRLPSNQIIEANQKQSGFVGHLFLLQIMKELGIASICKTICDKYKFKYDLTNILSVLIYTRILNPSSKLATSKLADKYLFQDSIPANHIYRALEILNKERDFILAALYKNTERNIARDNTVLYYDCTNYYFEIEEADDFRKFGFSKEHRPNPIVQMGLFIDANGIPLSYQLTPGNTNEQVTLKPLEKKLMTDFGMSRLVICTDAGLSSLSNRKYNDAADRAFITTQSLKILKGHLKEWALDSEGWHLPNSKNVYSINDIMATESSINRYYNYVFYKERWINENGLEQRLIVSFSPKYYFYQRAIREKQLERAEKVIRTGRKNRNPNDIKRFIQDVNLTPDGEIATTSIKVLDEDRIAFESAYDGFYCVATNLDSDVKKIIQANRARWQIEECFRILKTDFRARPVYLSRQDRIEGHFLTCFLALLVYRFLESKMGKKYTVAEIISQLRAMQLAKCGETNYVPAYSRTDITDELHRIFGFRTDYVGFDRKGINKLKKFTKI